MPYNTISRQRKEWAKESRAELIDIAKEYQALLINAIKNKYIDSLDINGKVIVFNTKNLLSLQRLNNLLDEVSKLQGAKLIDFMFGKIQTSAKLNLDYFSSLVEGGVKKAYDLASNKLLLRMGFDGNSIIKDTPLYDLSRVSDPIRRIKVEAVKAITTGSSYKEFGTTIENFIQGDKSGIIESHFKTNAYDTFQQMDRTMQFEMATSLQLDYFLFSEGLKETSRQFCIDRVGKGFTRKEIEGWKDLTFDGKPKENYDPFIDVGGHNCEHQLDAVTKEIYDRFK